ncbi:hypothetical protein AN214_02413 [Pseudoalteromonas sp. P1-9]|uniref:hypothetical protein n=1 Tax=Pseudoalteromonas sp. P1-9 TaxID=1710354 RepID=UPI0006D64124|nr:hypothetical protein [Pseudoalteromonas sp. P1-9]KPV95495.1 hypothetical protein AN214_02413 [Pseudoalteromonas sp. P1-9]
MKKLFYGFVLLLILVIIFLSQEKESINIDSVQSKAPELSKSIDALVELGRISAIRKENVISEIAKNDEQYGIFACIPDFLAWGGEGLDKSINKFVNSAGNLSDETSQLIYSVFSIANSSEERIERLNSALASGAQHPIIALNFIKYCSHTDSELCSEEAIEKAIQLDFQNGAIWLQSAIYFSKHNNEAKVIESLQELLQANFYNERYGEQIVFYAEALEAELGLSFNLGVIAGIGHAASQPYTFRYLTKWCKDKSDDVIGSDICIKASNDIQLRATTSISKMVGNSIQYEIFSSRGDKESLEDLEKQKIDNYPKGLSKDIELMLMLDPQLAYKYFTMFDLLGEGSTQSMIMKDSETLYSNFDSCSAVKSMSEFFL